MSYTYMYIYRHFLLYILLCIYIGWCYLKRINYSNGSRNPFPNLAAYELWTYIIFVLLPLLYIWVQCYIKIKVRLNMVHFAQNIQLLILQFLIQIKTSSFFTDVKLIFIPILFLLLRVWSFILDTIIVFNTETTEHFNESTTAAVFILMAVSFNFMHACMVRKEP